MGDILGYSQHGECQKGRTHKIETMGDNFCNRTRSICCFNPLTLLIMKTNVIWGT